MNQLAADQQITLQAFQAAVDTYKQRGLPLPASIANLPTDLDTHIDQLDALSETDPTFEMVYQSARSALQSQSSQRAKFLDTSAYIADSQTKLPHQPAQNGRSLANGQTTNGKNAHSPKPSPSPIKRFVLATNASESEKQYFHHYIEQLKQLNPEWSITLDTCNSGEAEAYVMLYQDENYKVNRAAYAAAQLVNQFFTLPQRQ